MGGFAELRALVNDAFVAESETNGGEASTLPTFASLSLHDLTIEECNKVVSENSNSSLSTNQKVSKLRILHSWKALMDILGATEVFVTHKKMLKRGYKVSFDGSIEEHNNIHIMTLVQLLSQTAEHATRDNSTECRFVTLLEVLLSYSGSNWEPSDDVSRLWIRLMQRIPYQCAPINFRRKAYRVLVSLSWVPSSHKGLLAACSIEERSLDPVHIPKSSQTWRSAIAENQFVPRHDSVNQLLDRLKDETDVCVAIASTQSGFGKSTLASLVVSHPSIRKSFHVVWIRLINHEEEPDNNSEESATPNNPNHHNSHVDTCITFRAYCDYVAQLQDQINEHLQARKKESDTNNGEGSFEIKFPKCERRFEEPALRQLRERQAIEETKRRVAKALYGRNVLLVLENVTSDSQIPLFRFHDKQSLIVTTTVPDLQNVDWQVDLERFSPEEAVDLFLLQAGLPLEHPIGQTKELAAVLSSKDCCHYQPLLIRTMARWCRLKSITAGSIQGLLEVLREIHSLPTGADAHSPTNYHDGPAATTGVDPDHPSTRFLFDILSLMMGPSRRNDSHHTTSAVFVICLATMAVVFPAPQRVPLDVVLLLWEQILVVEPLAADEVAAASKHRNGKINGNIGALERRRYVGLIAQGLLHMGLIEIYEVDKNGPWIEIHHEMYAQFALAMAQELDLGDSFEQTCQEWHKAFVTSYFEHRIQSGTSDIASKNSLEYAVRSLPSHIFEANMTQMAETILTDARFFESRVDVLGWDRAMSQHIHDCMELQSGIDEEMSVSSDTLVVSPVFSKTSTMIASFVNNEGDEPDDEKSQEKAADLINVSTALYRMAFSLAEHGYFEEALTQFDAAQNFMPDSLDLQACIQYGMAWVLLVSGDSRRALRKVIGSLKLMKDLNNDHALYMEARQLHIDTLYERCEYKKAINYLEEIEAELFEDEDKNRIEMGTVLKKKGSIFQAMAKTVEAVDAFSKSIEWKLSAEESSYGLASCFCQLGDLHVEQHALSAAKEDYDNANASLLAVKCDPEHVNFLIATGKSRFLKNDFSRCFVSLEFARNAISLTPLYLMDQSAYDLRGIARIFQARGRIDEAIAVFEESLALSTHRPDSLERSSCLLDVGRCYLERDKVDLGMECLKESLAIKSSKLGKSIQVSEILNLIGQVHGMRGAFDEALRAYSRSEEILNIVAPNDTEKLAAVMFAEGDVRLDQGDSDGSFDAYTRALQVLQRDHASDDAMIAKANHHMGRALANGMRLSEAKVQLQSAVSIRSVNFDEKALSESQHELGVVLRRLGEYSLAEKRLSEALAIRERLVGGDRLLISTKFEIANIFRVQAKPGNALSLYEDCINKLDTGAILRGDVYQAMGHVKFFGMKEDEALLFYRRARDIRQTTYGSKHRKTANTIRAIGLTQLLFNDRDGALKTLEDHFDLCEQQINGPDVDAADLVFDALGVKKDFAFAAIFLGDAYFVNNQIQEARFLWGKAKAKCAELNEIDITQQLSEKVVAMCERRLTGEGVSLDHEEAHTLLSLIFVDD